jgi:hypothetical protein
MSSPGSFVPGDVLGAADMNNLPGGVKGFAQATTNQGGITTNVDVTGLTVTFTAVANRYYRLTASLFPGSTVATDLIRVQITDGSNNVLTAGQVTAGAGTVTLERSVVRTFSAGSTTVKVRLQRNSGTGTITSNASADVPAQLIVDDIGPV